MPFEIVLPVLGTCFVAAWVFVGGLMLSDTLQNARRLRFDPPSELPHQHAS